MEFHQKECDAWVAAQHGVFSSAAMIDHLVQQGFDRAEAAQAVQVWKRRHSPAAAHDPFRFRRELGLPDDPKTITLDQLDELIAYHDALSERYELARKRLSAVSEQIVAAMREHGSNVVADLQDTDAAPLRNAWTEALADYNWCGREIKAIAAYSEPLDEEEG